MRSVSVAQARHAAVCIQVIRARLRSRVVRVEMEINVIDMPSTPDTWDLAECSFDVQLASAWRLIAAAEVLIT